MSKNGPEDPLSEAAKQADTNQTPPRVEPPDPFDPAALRLSPDFSEGLGVKRLITTIPCRKPNKTEWFRVRPGEEWRLTTAVFETDGVDRRTYLVAAHLRDQIADNLAPAMLVMCVNRAGDPFIWRIKLPGADGRTNSWTSSALAAAAEAETSWCRMVANMTSCDYSLYTSVADWPEPRWPELPFPEVLRLAFRDGYIDSLEHPVLRELRGLS
jgi:hypothetical protein